MMRYYDANMMKIRDIGGNHAEHEDMDGIRVIPCASPISLTDEMKAKIRAKKADSNNK